MYVYKSKSLPNLIKVISRLIELTSTDPLPMFIPNESHHEKTWFSIAKIVQLIRAFVFTT